MYPIHIYHHDTEIPTEGEYYIVAGNGTWFRKDTGLLSAVVPVPSIPFLADFDPGRDSIRCLLPKIPYPIVMKAKKFFVQIFTRYRSEACLILYYSKENSQYSVRVPRQWNNYGSVRYIRPANKEGYGLSVGTIHSHCDFGASHSSVDQEDESSFDGLHITFGDITLSSGMSIAASLVMNNQRYQVNPLDYLEQIAENADAVRRYRILPPAEQVDYVAWAAEVDSWFVRVNQGPPPALPWNEQNIMAWKEKDGNEED